MHLQFMSFPRALGCAAVLLFPLAACSAPADPFPTPGLYRVDSDGSMKYDKGSVRIAGNGADGAGVIEGQAVDKALDRRVVPASGPVTICMPARPVNGGLPLPNSGCRAGAPVVGPQGATYTAACGFMDLTTVVRKLDAKTWEYKVTSVERLGAAGLARLPDFAAQRKMFEQSAKNAPTAEERADAASVLSNWAEYVAEARASAAEAADLPQQDRIPQERRSTLVTRLTRIADSCSAQSARK
jgi:hypothetical protein